jgi:hypothetical protein
VGDNATAGSGIEGSATITISRVVYSGYQVFLQSGGGGGGSAAKNLLLLGVGA